MKIEKFELTIAYRESEGSLNVGDIQAAIQSDMEGVLAEVKRMIVSSKEGEQE